MYRGAAIVAKTEVRRVLRNVVTNRLKILLYVVAFLIGIGPILLIGGLLLSNGGEQLAAGEIDSADLESLPDIVAGVTAVLLLGLTVLATVRSFTNVADVDKPACLLISTPFSHAVVGLLVAELLLFALWLLPPTLILAGAFAYGAGTVTPVLVAPVVVTMLLTIAVSIGFVVGVCVRHLLTVYEPIAQYRTPLLVLVGAAYFVSIAFGFFSRLTAFLFELLGDSPLGWPGHFLLAGVPDVPFSAGLAGAGVALTVGVVPIAVFLGIRAAEFHWFADPAQSDDEEMAEVDSRDWLGAALTGVVNQPVRTVTVTAIRRTKRAPVRLLYVAYPLLMSLFFVQELIETGTLPSFGAVVLSLYVVWGAGVVFTLNILGDHGPAMEAVLTSTLSGREAIGGTVLAGLLVGVPAALVVGPVAGVASPLSVQRTVLLSVATLVGVVASPILAVGVGSLFPRFGSVRVMNKREAVMPSKTAFLLYTAAIMLPAIAAGILYTDSMASLVASGLSRTLSLLPSIGLTISETAVVGVAWVVLALGIAGPFLSVWYAVRRFDSFRPH